MDHCCATSRDLLHPDKARDIVLGCCAPLATETVALLDAVDRILAEDIAAREDIPIADHSAMDGFAARSADIAAASEASPVPLNVLGKLVAGQVSDQPIPAGSCLRIMTGAPMPPGADTVVPWEYTENESEARIRVKHSFAARENIVFRGADIQQGAGVLKAGQWLRPQEIGVLASLGYPKVPVHRRPKVLILATGDELIGPESPLVPGKVRSSNTYTLITQSRAAGGEAVDLGMGVDKLDEIVARVQSGLPADVVVTSGGSAQGDHDYTARVFQQLGAEILFHRVAIKPGKPVIFARKGQTLFFGLPGNPVASMVSFELFVRPAIRALVGHKRLERPRVRARLKETLGHEHVKRTFMRGILEPDGDGFAVRTTGRQGSSLLSSMSRANCLIVLEMGQDKYTEGTMVDVMLVDNPDVETRGSLV